MTQPPVQPPAWGGQAAQPGWQQPGAAPGWQQPGWQAPGVPRQPGPPAWEQQPGPPSGPPPLGGLGYGAPPKRSRAGLWWSLGAAAVAILVAAGVLVFVLLGGIDPPTGVSATAQEDGVAVTWQGVEGASSYEVFRNDLSIGTTGETTYLDAEAPGGTEVTYSVVASNADGDESDAAAAPAFVTAVNPPTALAATVDGPNILLTWEAVTGAETYQVTVNGSPLVEGLIEPNYTHEAAPLGDQSYEVTAVDVDGAGSTAAATVQVFAPGPWGDAYQIAQVFPDLISEEPGGDAWNGATCAAQPPEDSLALIRCDYADGLFMEARQFTDEAALGDYVALVEATPGAQPGTWSYGSGSAEGDLYLSADGDPDAWRFVTFYTGDQALFTLYAEWPGHSQEELRVTWFNDAPF